MPGTRRHRIAAAVTAAAVTLGGGAAAVVALSAPASAGSTALPATTTAATSTGGTHTSGTHATKAHHRSLLSRTDYATFEIRQKGVWVTRTLNRGKVTAVSSSSISLLRPDGTSVTIPMTSATKFGKDASASAIVDGRRATVLSENGSALDVIQGTHAAAGTKAPATSA